MTNPRDTPRWRGYEPAHADFERVRTELQTAFRFIDIDLSAAGSRVLEIAGDYLYIDTDPAYSNGAATLQFNSLIDADTAPFYVQPGFAVAVPFTKLRLRWSAQVGKRMRIIYATGASVIPTDSASLNIVGTVPILPEMQDDVAAGRAFTAQYGVAASGAGVYNTYYLWNPAGSGKNLLLDSVISGSTAAGANEAVLLVGPADPGGVDYYSAPTPHGVNMLLGGPAPVAVLRFATYVGALTAFFPSWFRRVPMGQSNSVEQIPKDAPIIIPPDAGVVAAVNPANVADAHTFQWRERAI